MDKNVRDLSPLEAVAGAIDAAGGGAKVCQLYMPPITEAAVSAWKKHGCPAGRVQALCEAGQWRFLPHQLRPDVFKHVPSGVQPSDTHPT